MTKNMTGQEITKRRVAAIKKAKKVKPLTQKERYQLKKKRMEEWKSWLINECRQKINIINIAMDT